MWRPCDGSVHAWGNAGGGSDTGVANRGGRVCGACACRVALLVNPAAGGGAGRRRAPALARALARAGASAELLETRGPGDARRIVDACRRAGVDVIAVAGGDGTLNEVCQAYLDRDGRPVAGPPLALLPMGTGGDFRRTIAAADGLDRAVERVLSANRVPSTSACCA